MEGNDMDDVWGIGEEYGMSPRRAAHIRAERWSSNHTSPHDDDDDDDDDDPYGPDGKPSARPRTSRHKQDKQEPSPSNDKTRHLIRHQWGLSVLLLSRPVACITCFLGLPVLAYFILKYLIILGPAILVNKAVSSIVSGFAHVEQSASQWLRIGGKRADDLPRLTFRRPVTKAESEVLPKDLDKARNGLVGLFPLESYDLQADFDHANAVVGKLEKLNQDSIEQLEARATRVYQQLIVLIEDLSEVPDGGGQDPWATHWWSLPWHDASWFQAKKAKRYKSRLSSIIQGGMKDLETDQDRIAQALGHGHGRNGAVGEEGLGICRSREALPLRTESKTIGKKDVFIVIDRFRKELKAYHRDIDEPDADQADAVLRQIKKRAVELAMAYQRFAGLQRG
ncbi:hypothetical protein CEP54_014058 [Fusarium duplospermum]|uniref:Uncharacterized protein n=1 Tax=Fusarium duplospermum TaxID=1325734 RepID=A0A428NYR4_9HYPO|nr:hypothetical protein CEP54_014058 [Fusarium duplospermum]